ncbi:MAG: hypothetical protein LBU58_04805 [Clostridiales bacterium]|nr:hypothetical protein [Clostridiales bacterium]
MEITKVYANGADQAVKSKLLSMPTERLVQIVLAALETMDQIEQLDFIARHIDAQASLKNLGADDPEAFLEEVDEFCLDCLNEVYFSDDEEIEDYFSDNGYGRDYYDDDWDYAEFYRNTEWAENFSRLFKLSAMYIRSGDISTGYEADARLLSCLKHTMSNSSFLGTHEPMEYISADWGEVFSLYYDALFKVHADTGQAIEKAFRCWMDFGGLSEEGFLDSVKDLAAAEHVILGGIKGSDDWTCQRACFELLAQLYSRLGKNFEKAAVAETLISHNVYFYLFVVEGLCEQARWQSAVEAARIALERIPMPKPPANPSGGTDYFRRMTQKKIRAAIFEKLVDAYESLSEYGSALEASKQMFHEAPAFDLYVRARGFAEKGGDLSADGKNADVTALLAFAEKRLCQQSDDSELGRLRRNLYSYEGESRKLLDRVLSLKIDSNYYDRKYTALSLIYRAVSGAENIGEALSEYLASASASENEGIADMRNLCADRSQRTELLLKGADLLRGVIAFHIDAAVRSRYAKAAYYMRVLRDIFVYLQKEDEFQRYFDGVMEQNKRRHALRDEMRIVYRNRPVQRN